MGQAQGLPETFRTEQSTEPSRIRLRLGSTTFECATELITSGGGMLKAMFTSDMRPGAVDETGAYILDRDPIMFSYVIRHLEGDSTFMADLSHAGLVKLQTECGFFQLSQLQSETEREIATRLHIEQLNSQEMQRLTALYESERHKNSRTYKKSGCLVEHANAAIGERVVRKAHPGEELPEVRSPRLCHVGTIMSITENGTELAVKWDDGSESHLWSGKKISYALEYA